MGYDNFIDYFSWDPVITTEKVYALISLVEYRREKDLYLKQLARNYAIKKPQEKWPLLIDRYKFYAPSLSVELEKFKEERSNTTNNIFNLSLESCIAYFEDFCFLSETKNSKFKLSKDQNTSLKQAVSDAINTCETGKSMRFEGILQLYRNDGNNWVTKLLSTHRYNLLLQLSDCFNTKYYVNDALSVHTLAKMMQIANLKKLGIKTDHPLHDVYLTPHAEQRIQHYFTQHYFVPFLLYEKNIVEDLSLHLLFEIKNLYEDASRWEKNETLAIPPERTLEFCQMIQDRLGFHRDKEGVEVVDLLGDWTDEGTFALHKKDQMLVILQRLIQEKLTKEQYIIELSKLSKNNLPFNKKLLRPEKHREAVVCVQFNEALKALNTSTKKRQQTIDPFSGFGRLIRRHIKLLSQHPELLSTYLDKNPAFVTLFPRILTSNPLFSEWNIQLFDRLLCKAMQTQQTETIHSLTPLLADLMKNNLASFKRLSPPIQGNLFVALQLLKKNPLFISVFSPTLRASKAIAKAAIAQEPFTIFYLPPERRAEHLPTLHTIESYLNDFYDTTLMTRRLQKIRGNEHRILDIQELLAESNPDDHPTLLNPRLFLQDQAIADLLLSDRLSTYRVGQLTQYISPEQFMEIVIWRIKNQLPSLPYVGDLAFLKKFLTLIETHGIPSCSENNWLIHREASRLLHPKAAPPELITAFETTRSWYFAFVTYQHLTEGHFKNKGQLWFQLSKIFNYLSRFCLAMLPPISIGGSSLFATYLFCAAKNIALISHLPLFVPFIGLNLLLGAFWAMFQYLFESEGLADPCFFVGFVGFFSGIQFIQNFSAVWGLLVSLVSLTLLIWPSLSEEQSLSVKKIAYLSFLILPLGPLPFSAYFSILYFATALRTYHPLFLRVMKEIDVLLNRLMDTFFSKKITPNWPDDLRLQSEEKIATLLTSAGSATQDKAHIMEDLWHGIEEEQQGTNDLLFYKNTAPLALKKSLNKRYTFFYRGKACSASFSEIDGLPCSEKNNGFELPSTMIIDTSSSLIKETTLKLASQ